MKIITLTLSPALDVEYRTEKISADGLNRTSSHTVSAGGKGINVSRIIERMLRRRIMLPEPVELRTVAPVGGETGELLVRLLEKENIFLTGVPIEENTRINTSLIPEEGKALEINAPGSPVGNSIEKIECAVLDDLCENDIVIIAGSCPADVEKSYPAQLCRKVKEKGAVCIIDCDGEALRCAVNADCPPDLIKPNRDELAALAGHALESDQEIAQTAENLAVPVVITTMAEKGAVITRDVNGYRASTYVPTVKRKTVRLKGAGDTFLGAFVYAKYAMKMNDIGAMEFASEAAANHVSANT